MYSNKITFKYCLLLAMRSSRKTLMLEHAMEDENLKWVKEQEASKVMSVPVQTFRNWRTKGKGPAYHKLGSSVRYALSDLHKFMQDHRIEPREG